MQFSLFPRRTAALFLLLAAAGAAAGIAFGLTAAQPPPLYEAAGPVHATSSAAASAARSEPGSAGTSAPASESALPPMVCLTFDDGPSRTTPAVLEALADEEVPATFFVVANENNERYLPLIRQAQQAGHEIALHSASHRYSDIYRSTDEIGRASCRERV